MKYYHFMLASVLMTLPCKNSLAADVNCTAAPDCGTLGYTKTATQCPDGGVRCPFNQNLMFCLKNGGGNDFKIKNKVNEWDIVYSDGTTASTLKTSKVPIGVAVVTEKSGSFNHGFVVSMVQPHAATWSEAIKWCNNFAATGTSEGDWELPNIVDWANFGDGNTYNSNSGRFTAFQNKMKLLPYADKLGSSYSAYYCENGAGDKSSSYLKESPACTNITSSSCTVNFTARDTQYRGCTPLQIWNDRGGGYTGSCGGIDTYTQNWTGSKSCSGTCPPTRTLTSNYYWTISETPDTNAYPYYTKIDTYDANKIIKGTSSDKTKKSLFRCIMRFQEGEMK